MIRKVVIVLLTLVAIELVFIHVASYRRKSVARIQRARAQLYGCVVTSTNGVLTLSYYWCPDCARLGSDHDPTCAWHGYHVYRRSWPTEKEWRLGELALTVRKAPAVRGFVIELPVWPLIILFAFYPTIAFIRGPVRRTRPLHGSRWPAVE